MREVLPEEVVHLKTQTAQKRLSCRNAAEPLAVLHAIYEEQKLGRFMSYLIRS